MISKKSGFKIMKAIFPFQYRTENAQIRHTPDTKSRFSDDYCIMKMSFWSLIYQFSFVFQNVYYSGGPITNHSSSESIWISTFFEAEFWMVFDKMATILFKAIWNLNLGFKWSHEIRTICPRTYIWLLEYWMCLVFRPHI